MSNRIYAADAKAIEMVLIALKELEDKLEEAGGYYLLPEVGIRIWSSNGWSPGGVNSIDDLWFFVPDYREE